MANANWSLAGQDIGVSLDDSKGQLTLFNTKESRAAAAELHTNLLALSNAKGLGEASLKALFRAFPDLEEVWEASPREIQQVLANAGLKNARDVADKIRDRRRNLRDAASRGLERLEKQGIKLLTVRDLGYPEQLRSATLAQ